MGVLFHRFVIKFDGIPERSYIALATCGVATLEIKVIGFAFVGGTRSACLLFLGGLQLETFDNLTVNLICSIQQVHVCDRIGEIPIPEPPTIRDVLLFPTMRPRHRDEEMPGQDAQLSPSRTPSRGVEEA